MEAILRLQGICKAYHQRPILQDFSLEIHPGDFILLTGESGIGKTTLLNIMAGFEQPDAGSVIFEHTELTKASQRVKMQLYRQKMSFVFQHGNLVKDRSVKWNLELPLIPLGVSKAEKEKRIAAALEEVNLSCLLTEKVVCLSGGEMRRLAVARALIKPFDLLFLDEPTASLDHESAETIVRVLEKYKQQGKTIVTSTHDTELFMTLATSIVQVQAPSAAHSQN